MSEKTDYLRIQLDHIKAPRCKDYDKDCVDVRNKFKCWQGNKYTDHAEGYCPWVFGMISE
jgi:hypothetical protein